MSSSNEEKRQLTKERIDRVVTSMVAQMESLGIDLKRMNDPDFENDVGDRQLGEQIRDMLTNYPILKKEWHAGRTVGRTLYQGEGGGEDCIGLMDSGTYARFVVLCQQYVVRKFG